MSGSVNKVTLVGNLGRDPEIRTLNSGDKIASLRIATSETWKDKASGERKERTEWHSVSIFNEALVGVAEKYLRKGSTVYLEGSLQTRKWTDQSGADKYTTEVVLQRFKGDLVMLGGKPAGDDRDEASDFRGTGSGDVSRGRDRGPRESFAADLNDEVPFVSREGIR